MEDQGFLLQSSLYILPSTFLRGQGQNPHLNDCRRQSGRELATHGPRCLWHREISWRVPRHGFFRNIAKQKRANQDFLGALFVDRARIELATHGFSGRCSTD